MSRSENHQKKRPAHLHLARQINALRWSYLDGGYGDCEDYVLLKRHIFIQSAWPREALLVTVVRDKDEEGHAVLTVITDKGDYVLDNQTEDILLWSETGYRFVKRQSQSNPNLWVSLDDLRPAIATVTHAERTSRILKGEKPDDLPVRSWPGRWSRPSSLSHWAAAWEYYTRRSKSRMSIVDDPRVLN
jgi:hypothetical protein